MAAIMACSGCASTRADLKFREPFAKWPPYSWAGPAESMKEESLKEESLVAGSWSPSVQW